MTMNTAQKLEAAQRLVQVVTGEPYGDGETVTDIGVGYAEPGYHDDETVWVLGDFNDKLSSRLFDALERLGIEGEWLDEWYRCDHCQRIVRCSGDSYSWQPYYVMLEDGDVLCGDCVVDPDFIQDVIEIFVNDPNRAVTFIKSEKLESLGWRKYNKRKYQNGLHEGMNDNPKTIYEKIKEENPNVDVIFFLDGNSQFYLEFSAFIKDKEEE